LNHVIVRGVLRLQPSIEFHAASDSRLRGLKDPEVLAATARDGRILVTHDQSTMPTEFAKFLEVSSGSDRGAAAPLDIRDC
jgi:predicted nuclease of predicted toxin-antitoxin system